jgi:hypothetical protein
MWPEYIRLFTRQIPLYICVFGTFLQGWYGYLEKTFGPSTKKNLAKKVAADQLMFAPFFYASVLAVIEGSRNGRDWDKTKSYVRSIWKDVITTNWMIWP